MSNGGNGLLGIYGINSFSSLVVFAGKHHLRTSTKVLKCLCSEGLAQKQSSISTLPSIFKSIEFFYYGQFFTFFYNQFLEICCIKKDKI